MWSGEADELFEAIQDESEEEYSPSVKKQKQRKQQWTEKSLLDALNCCKNQELGVEEASIIYGVPKRSLRSRLKDKNFSVIDDKFRVFVPPLFPLQAESELVEYLQTLINSQFTFTSIEIRRIAYELMSEKYGISNMPQEKDCLLGNRWYRTFMAKYPHLDTEKTLSFPKAFLDTSERFFNSLESLATEHGINAERIFCVDGIELKFRASNAYDFDKIYHRRKIIYTDGKAICCISASGAFIPPLFIKPGEKGTNSVVGHTVSLEDDNDVEGGGLLRSNSSKIGAAYDELKDLCESEAKLLPTAEEIANIRNQIKAHLNKKVQSMNEENEEELREKLYEQFNKLRSKIISKYENSLNIISYEIFHDWFIGFLARVKPSNERKIILLLGNQNYVKCLKTLELAKANGVLFLVLPPHSVHKIYPLDGFTMSLNRNLSTCASVWLGKNPDFKIQEVPLKELFCKAYRTTVNPTIAKNGFVYSGIWPVNRNIFESTELGGESLLLKNPCQLPYEEGTSQNGINGLQAEKAIDVSKLCRVCMKEKMYMKPLLETGEANYYGKKISEIVGREVTPDDGLPHFICQYCLVQLMDMVKIRNLAAESQKKMLKLREKNDGFYFDQSGVRVLTDLHCQIGLPEKDFDINAICRICAGEKPLMTSIFYGTASTSSPDLPTRINEVSKSQIHMEDGFSSSICAFCRTSINQAWEFIQKVSGSDRRFREIFCTVP